jgi:sec-independent protein translocase protein TatA
MDIGPPELILILVVVLVLFGGAQLPKLAKNLGKAQREFKSAMQQGGEDEPPAAAPVGTADAAVSPEAAVAPETTTKQDDSTTQKS